mgnify:CR=1 FL=1
MKIYYELQTLHDVAISISGGSYIPHWNKVISRKPREKGVKYLYTFIQEFLSNHKNEELINKVYKSLNSKKIEEGNDYIVVAFYDRFSKRVFNHLDPHLHGGESYAHRDKLNLIDPNKKPYDYGVYRKNN